MRDLHLYFRFPGVHVGAHCVSGDARFVVGRLRDCDVVLHHPSMGRRYAAFFLRKGQWRIRQLGSSNPIVVHRAGRDPIVSWLEEVALEVGDRIQLAFANGFVEVEDAPPRAALLVPGESGPLPLGRTGMCFSEVNGVWREVVGEEATSVVRVTPEGETLLHEGSGRAVLRNGAPLALGDVSARVYSRREVMTSLPPNAEKIFAMLSNKSPAVVAQAIEVALAAELDGELVVPCEEHAVFGGEAREAFVWAATNWRVHRDGARAFRFAGYEGASTPGIPLSVLPESVSVLALTSVARLTGTAPYIRDVTLSRCGKALPLAFPDARRLRLERGAYDSAGASTVERLEVLDASVPLTGCAARELRWESRTLSGLVTTGMRNLTRLELPHVRPDYSLASFFRVPSLKVVAAPTRPRDLPAHIAFELLSSESS